MTVRSRRHAVWNETGLEAQRSLWRAQLDAARGNITHAGIAMGFTKAWSMRLTRLHSLNAYAAELRRRHGGRSIGRPPGSRLH